MKESNLTWFRKGIKNGIPIALGYLAVSFTLGIQARKIGITAFQAAVASFGLHASAGEYIAFTLFGANASLLVMVMMEIVANARYLLMSCALSQKTPTDTPIWKRLLMGYFVTDEIFGVSIAVPNKLNPFYNFGMAAVASPGWVVGTALGVLLGNALPARVVSALSVGLYGMFIACIIPEGKKNRIVAGVIVISFGISYVFNTLKIFAGISSGVKIMIMTVVISLGAAILFPIEDKDAIEDNKEEVSENTKSKLSVEKEISEKKQENIAISKEGIIEKEISENIDAEVSWKEEGVDE